MRIKAELLQKYLNEAREIFQKDKTGQVNIVSFGIDNGSNISYDSLEIKK